jgi:hypothetical protein
LLLVFLVILVYDSMCAAAWHEGMLLSNNEKLPEANMGFVLMLLPLPEFPPLLSTYADHKLEQQ